VVTPTVQELARNGARVMPGRRVVRPAALADAARGDDLAAIVRAADEGDDRAWEQLVRRLDPLVRRVARGFRLAPSDVDDVVQRTWLTLLQRIHTVNDPARLPGWLATTTRRLCLDLLQGQLREIPMDAIEPCGAEPSPEDQVIAAEHSRMIRGAVAGLPKHQRTLVTLMTQDPVRPYAEIAEMLRIPIGSIGPTYGRSVLRLRGHGELAGLRGE
jgi:RNA polymerase sigma factor (sigma-70 family)